MSGAAHLSMRVLWRDRPWDAAICDYPLGNSSSLGVHRRFSQNSPKALPMYGELEQLPSRRQEWRFVSGLDRRVDDAPKTSGLTALHGIPLAHGIATVESTP